MKKYRIVSGFRLTVFVTIVLVTVFLVCCALFDISTAGGASFNRYKVVIAETGDTLWNIAAENMPEDQLICEYIYEIEEINDLETPELSVGQRILVPVYEEKT